MAITSTESYLALLEKSQLLSERDLEKVRAVAAKYSDAKALAKALVTAKGLTRWQAAQLLAGRSSFMLGKYRLLDLLGRGGMGSVFAAEHTKFGRRVALKIISKQTGRDPEQLERFLAETRRIAALDHPNIVRAFDVDHEGERYFLVMEYVEGRDLQQIVESDGPLDVGRVARFIRQAALGLAHAHQRKMIHCDIKPSNLIVGNDEVVKILDMGMARLLESDGSTSDSNENIVGTIDYIAPEQALEAEDLDHRADIYSLGCTLYFLLTSRPPFGEGTLAQRIMKHQTQDPRPISETRSGVPDSLVGICLKMMAKKPEDRFQTAEEVARALERWATGGAGPATVAVADAPKKDNEPAVVELIGDDDAPSRQDVGEVSISVAGSGSFSTRAGSSRGRRTSEAKKPVEGPAEVVLSDGFFSDPRKKWAAIVLAGVLLLGGVGGGLAWMMGGNTSQPGAAEDTLASAQPVADQAPAARLPQSEPQLDNDLADLDAMFGKTEGRAKELPAEDAEKSPPAPGAATEKPAESKPTESTPAEESAKTPEEPKKEPAKTEGEEESKPAEKKDKEAEKKPAAEEKKPPGKKPAPVEPFKDFPTAFNIPILNDNDAPGEASKTPVTLGAIHGPADLNWQMLLLGGDKFLKGGRSFTLARTDPDAAKAAWSVQIAGTDSAEKPEDAARLWREGESLKFQWAEKAPGAAVNYLRNCILQLRVSGESRYAALTEPIQAEPIVLDLIRGQNNGSVGIKWAPDEELLRFKFGEIDGVEKAVFEPAEPVVPRTQVALNFTYTDRYKNDSKGVVYRVLPTSRKGSLHLDVRLMQPTSREFQLLAGNNTEQQLGVMIDRLGNKRTELEAKMKNLKGGEAEKTTREIDGISRQIWYFEFFRAAHKKATLHYQVTVDVGGQELLLVTTK